MNKVMMVLILSFLGIGKMGAQNKKEFKDAPNTAAYTTKFVISDNKTITYVSHDADDGAWQFMSDDEFESYEEVAKVVSLQNIVKRDPTVLEVSDMEEGYYATRKNKDDKWVIRKQD